MLYAHNRTDYLSQFYLNSHKAYRPIGLQHVLTKITEYIPYPLNVIPGGDAGMVYKSKHGISVAHKLPLSNLHTLSNLDKASLPCNPERPAYK